MAGCKLKRADPIHGCEPLTNNVAGAIIIVERGGCKFHSKALNAQNSGAAALVIVNLKSKHPVTMWAPDGVSGDDVIIPVISIGNVDGNTLRAPSKAMPLVTT